MKKLIKNLFNKKILEFFRKQFKNSKNNNRLTANINPLCKLFNLLKNTEGLPIDASGEVLIDVNKETGFIAQEVYKIDELKHAVQEGDLVPDASGNMYKSKFGLCYEEIFVYNVVATQELDRKLIALETKNSDLENEVTTLKSELAAIKQHLGI